MNSDKWGYIGYAMAWFATGAAVVMAIYVTKSADPIWFMIIPGCISVTSHR